MSNKKPDEMTPEEIETEIATLEGLGSLIEVHDTIRLGQLRARRKGSVTPVSKVASGVLTSEEAEQGNITKYISIDLIDMPDYSDRSGVSEAGIRELAQSIKDNGLIMPIAVYKSAKERYTKLAGRRRILACKQLGHLKIKASILPEGSSEKELLLKEIHENTQREDLSVFDKVRNVLQLIGYELGIIDRDEIIKITRRASNFQKGSVKEAIDVEVVERIKTTIEQSMLFNTISTLVSKLSVLNMCDDLLNAMRENKITFDGAELLDKFSDKVTHEIFKKVLDEVIAEEMGSAAIKHLISTYIQDKKETESSLVVTSINKKVAAIKKIISKETDIIKLKQAEAVLSKFLEDYN